MKQSVELSRNSWQILLMGLQWNWRQNVNIIKEMEHYDGNYCFDFGLVFPDAAQAIQQALSQIFDFITSIIGWRRMVGGYIFK